MKFQIKFPSVSQVVTTFLPSVVVLAMIFPIMSFFDLKLRWLLREPTEVGDLNPLVGYLSNMGMLMWSATIAITLFTAVILYKQVSLRKTAFFASAAIFSAMLLVDDMFLFHETLAPKYLKINELAIYGVYIVMALAFFGFFFKDIYSTNYVGLLIALGFMGASIGCDYLQNVWLWKLGQWEYLLEEGLKWFGIVWWCSYFAQTAHGAIKNLLKPAAGQ